MCSIKDCNNPEHARGYCKAHYTNYMNTGHPKRRYRRHDPAAHAKLAEEAANGGLQHLLDQDYTIAAVAEYYRVSIPALDKYIKNYNLRRIAKYQRGKTNIALADKISPMKRLALYGDWNITKNPERYHFSV